MCEVPPEIRKYAIESVREAIAEQPERRDMFVEAYEMFIEAVEDGESINNEYSLFEAEICIIQRKVI